MSRARLSIAFASLAALIAACGGSSGSVFSDPNTDPNAGANGSGSADQGQFSNDPIGSGAACVTSTKSATLSPVNLVIMYDKSGSMGDPAEGGDPNVKWIPVNTGMKSFFADPKSAGYNASLQFFPAPGDLNTTCNAPYGTPLVALTSLAQSSPLVSALNAAKPQGGTPTLPALQGALAYAQKTIQARPDEKTVVVLVTDGEPGLMVNGTFQEGCPNNDIQHVAAAAAAAYQGTPSIPTYVIGVGPSLTKLNEVASAGGTNQAFMIPVSDPTQTTSELQKAFESIRSQQAISCSFPMPAAPAGQRLDTGLVNVGYTNGAGAESPLVYSTDCSAANGWHYDNFGAPTEIELCPSACTQAQSDPNGKLTIAFGCVTVGAQK